MPRSSVIHITLDRYLWALQTQKTAQIAHKVVGTRLRNVECTQSCTLPRNSKCLTRLASQKSSKQHSLQPGQMQRIAQIWPQGLVTLWTMWWCPMSVHVAGCQIIASPANRTSHHTPQGNTTPLRVQSEPRKQEPLGLRIKPNAASGTTGTPSPTKGTTPCLFHSAILLFQQQPTLHEAGKFSSSENTSGARSGTA